MVASTTAPTDRVRTSSERSLAPAQLRERYRAYRQGQAAQLVRLLPLEAVRPLYRRARMAVDFGDGEDPLAVLVSYCEQLLPLPPFEVWLEDLTRHPDAHLRDLGESADAPTADAPSTLAVRDLWYGGRPWQAHLRAFRSGGAWRGYIAFEEDGRGRVHRTATVFRERDPAEVRKRFLSFEHAALEAFLRSSLP